MYVPDLSVPDQHLLDIPNQSDFSLKILDVRKSNCDPYSRIKNSCFSLKMVQNLNQKWRVSSSSSFQNVRSRCWTPQDHYCYFRLNVKSANQFLSTAI